MKTILFGLGLFILGVTVFSFLLLMVAYRSLVIPAKAAAMNLLSIGAAYGVVVMVFQYGWGAELIGLDGPVPIESFVPMMMFAVLFGLSMDYEVFLLTSFREHWERSGDVAVAVRRALADTGQVITAAALIMVGVFASFIIADQTIALLPPGFEWQYLNFDEALSALLGDSTERRTDLPENYGSDSSSAPCRRTCSASTFSPASATRPSSRICAPCSRASSSRAASSASLSSSSRMPRVQAMLPPGKA